MSTISILDYVDLCKAVAVLQGQVLALQHRADGAPRCSPDDGVLSHVQSTPSVEARAEAPVASMLESSSSMRSPSKTPGQRDSTKSCFDGGAWELEVLEGASRTANAASTASRPGKHEPRQSLNIKVRACEDADVYMPLLSAAGMVASQMGAARWFHTSPLSEEQMVHESNGDLYLMPLSACKEWLHRMEHESEKAVYINGLQTQYSLLEAGTLQPLGGAGGGGGGGGGGGAKAGGGGAVKGSVGEGGEGVGVSVGFALAVDDVAGMQQLKDLEVRINRLRMWFYQETGGFHGLLLWAAESIEESLIHTGISLRCSVPLCVFVLAFAIPLTFARLVHSLAHQY
jgi:hypothetical protein